MSTFDHHQALLHKYGLVTPDLTVALPSGGKAYAAYDDGSQISSIQVRAMTVSELDMLTKREDLEDLTFVAKVTAACLIPPERGWPGGKKTIDVVRELIDGDLESVLVGIRICTYGATFDYLTTCVGCSKEFAVSHEFNTIDLLELKADPVAKGVNKFEISNELLFGGVPILVSLPTSAENEERRRRTLVRKERQLDSRGHLLPRLEDRVIQIGSEKSRGDITFLLSRLGAAGIEVLEAELDKLEFGPVLDHEAKCPFCKRGQKSSAPLLQAVFFR